MFDDIIGTQPKKNPCREIDLPAEQTIITDECNCNEKCDDCTCDKDPWDAANEDDECNCDDDCCDCDDDGCVGC